jgi:hypothetical protein
LQALRELAQCPELLDAWSDARRFAPERIERDADIEERPALRRRQRALSRQRERLERLFLDRLVAGEEVDERDYRELMGAIQGEEDQLAQRLAHPRLGLAPTNAAAVVRERDAAGLRQAFDDVLTLDVPVDPALRIQREALVVALLDGLTVRDEAGGVVLALQSAFGPPED